MTKKKIWLARSAVAMLVMVLALLLFPRTTEAAGSYYIKINRSTNVVTVYSGSTNAPVKAFTCSTGGSNTPLGTFSLGEKYRWHTLDGPTYGQYCTRITGGVLFHSVWYYENGNKASQSTRQFNKLGTAASHGCVRLTTADAKWIYDNCPSGTTVTIFTGTSADDPLGKPAVPKVSESSSWGWDPTDVDPANPHMSGTASIDVSGVSKEVAYGSEWDPYDGVSAKLSSGVDISAYLTHSGTVNTDKLGTYTVNYSVAFGSKTATASVKYKVKDLEPPIISGVPSKKTKEYNSTYNLKKGVTAKNVTGKKLTAKIKIKVKEPGAKSAKTYKKTKIKLTKTGTYTVTYTVKNTNNKLTTSKTLKIKVQDTKAPTVTLSSTKKYVAYGKTVNLRSGVKAKLLSGKGLTKKMTVSIKVPGASSYTKLSDTGITAYQFSQLGKYKVKYVSKNPTSGKKTTKYRTYVSRDMSTPNLTVPAASTVEYNDTMNLVSGVSASYAVKGTSLTGKIVVAVQAPGESSYKTLSSAESSAYRFTKTGAYTVKYTVANPNKTSVTKSLTRVINVQDTQKPVLETPDLVDTAQCGQTIDLTKGTAKELSAKLVSGQDITAQVAVSVTYEASAGADEEAAADPVTVTVADKTAFVPDKAGTYTVTYRAENPLNRNNAAEASLTITVTAADTQSGDEAGNDSGVETDTDVGNSTDTDTNTDSNTNTENGSDTDTSINMETGSEADTGAEAGNGTETDINTDADSGSEIDTGAEAGNGTETDANTDTDTDTETGSGIEAGTETGNGVETDTNTDTNTNTETGSETEAGTGTGTDAETEDNSANNTDAGAETGER